MSVNNPQFVDNVVRFIEATSMGMKRACDEISVHRAMQAKAAPLQTPVFDAMQKIGAVLQGEEAAAKAMLSTHEGTLALLKNAVDECAELRAKLAEKTGEANVNRLGGPAGAEKTGSAKPNFDSMNDPFLGRPTSEKKASDTAILRVLDTPATR